MVSRQIVEILIKADDQASATAEKVEQKLKGFGDTASSANSFAARATERMRSALTSLSGSMNIFGSSGSKIWNSFKTRVSSAAGTLKGKFSNAVNSAKAKLQQLKASAQSSGRGFGFLRSALSMTVGMIGYDLLSSLGQAARESINAAGKFQAFGKRMRMSDKELASFSAECDKLQGSFRKVDMRAVGASAMELGVKLKVPKDQMGELTKMTAVMSSAFVSEGRTQEDAILAVSDAMDGQFRRLQELGIDQDKLMKNGWNGNLEDTNSLMKAMNKTLDEMGFTETAKGIYTLDDAYKALTVSGGRLLADIIIPLTPIITGAIDAITGGISMLRDAWNSLPDWAKDAIVVGVLAGAFILLAAYITTLGGVIAVLGSILGPVITLIGAISTPMIVAAAVIGAIIYAVYELGKAFGWWSDVGTMIDAIKAGISRLWDAFINNPNVQGFLKDLSNAWNDVSKALQPVIRWAKDTWKELFPGGKEGEVDIVRMIIDAFGGLGDILGKVWNAAKNTWSSMVSFVNFLSKAVSPIMPVVDALRKIVCALLGCSPGIVPALLKVQAMFFMVWTAISSFVPGLIRKIVAGILTRFAQMPAKIRAYLGLIKAYIISQGSAWVKNARNKASAVVTGVVNFIKNLPGRVSTYIVSTAHKITTGAAKWVSNAKSKASGVVNAVVGQVNDLPGKVYSEFTSIGARMSQAGSALYNKAKAIGKGIVRNLLNSMQIHSPGIIQRKVVAEFENTLSRVGDMENKAYKTGSGFGSAIVDGFGDVDLANQQNYEVYTGNTQKIEMQVTHDHNYSFEGLPESVSAKEVADMINEAAQDDEFTRRLANNPRFQYFDSKQKTRLNRRRGRSKGVVI